MPSYMRWFRLGKEALKEKNEEAIEDIKKRLSPVPGLWEQIVMEYKQENQPPKKVVTRKTPTKKTPAKKAVTKKTSKVKKDE